MVIKKQKGKKKSVKHKITKGRLANKTIAKVGSISLLEDLGKRLVRSRTYRYVDADRIESEINKPATWFNAVQKEEHVSPSYIWHINKEKIYGNYSGKYWKYYDEVTGEEKQSHEKPPTPEHSRCMQYNPPIETLVLPSGKVIVPIRQFCETKVLPQGVREAFFYDFGPVTFPDVYQESWAPPATQQMITQNRAEVRPRGTRIDISMQRVEDTPVDVITSANRSFALESISDENEEILGRTFEKATMLKNHWVNGNTGKLITSDAGLSRFDTLTIKGLLFAKGIIEEEGLDTSNLILYTAGKGIRDLVMDPDLLSYLGEKRPEIITQGTLEKILEMKLVRSSAVPRVSELVDIEEPLPETYWGRFKRVLLFRKRPTHIVKREQQFGYHSALFLPNITFGLVTGENLTMEAQRRNELQVVALTGTQRTAGILKNKECIVKISHA